MNKSRSIEKMKSEAARHSDDGSERDSYRTGGDAFGEGLVRVDVPNPAHG